MQGIYADYQSDYYVTIMFWFGLFFFYSVPFIVVAVNNTVSD